MRVNHTQFSEAVRLVQQFSGKTTDVAKVTVGEKSATLHKRDGDAEITVSLPCDRGPLLRQETMAVPIEATIKALRAVKPRDPLLLTATEHPERIALIMPCNTAKET